MEKRPLIFISTENYPQFCDNRCNNKDCSKHISKMLGYYGGCKITKLRGAPDCEGFISTRKKEASSHKDSGNGTP